MKFDYQEIHSNYVTRLVIFSVFLFKETRKQEHVFQESVRGFLKKRLHYDIDFSLEVGPKVTKDEHREMAIDAILNNNEDLEVLNLVQVRFKTGFKDINLQIDLNQELKYESIIYS